MGKEMDLSKKLLEELKKHNKINNYIFEQDAPPPPDDLALGTPPPTPEAGALPAAPEAGAPPEAPAAEPSAPIDVESDPDVEKIGDETSGDSETEELDITELVTSQKNMEEKQNEYFQNLFSQIQNLESKLSEMDKIMDKINSIETKIEKYREKTPQEKLELRSLDSGPFNQKLTQFFDDKLQDIEKSGKNEYVITPDDVENYSQAGIKNSFNNLDSEEDDTNTYTYR
jgi:hypothetical protein